MDEQVMSPAVSGAPRILLRLEGLTILIGCLCAFWFGPFHSLLGLAWPWVVLIFFAPDLSMLAYLAGPRIGAAAYNLAHTLAMPALVLTAGVVVIAMSLKGSASGLVHFMEVATAVAVLWTAHIGFDRALGYGLKYASGFGHTHLGRIGRPKA